MASILTAAPRITGKARARVGRLSGKAGGAGLRGGTRMGVLANRIGLRSGARSARIGAFVGRRGMALGARGAALGAGLAGRGMRMYGKGAGRGAHRGSKLALRGGRVGVGAATLAPKALSALGELQGAPAPPRRSHTRSGSAGGMLAGATAMYFLDPAQGKRRRHMARDRAMKLIRRGGHEAAAKARYAEGVAEGKIHEMRSEGEQPGPRPDDVTLARKVESEIFRETDAPKGSVDVNVEQGVVYLRGEVGTAERQEALAGAARAVEGVQGVKNLLHLPGEQARTIEDTRNSS